MNFEPTEDWPRTVSMEKDTRESMMEIAAKALEENQKKWDALITQWQRVFELQQEINDSLKKKIEQLERDLSYYRESMRKE